MNHASLFSGIGGFDLAAEWMGWHNVFHSEVDTFCNKILKHHFPNSISYGNIKETDFTPHKGVVDILTGGFPCQPFSSAGLRNGTDDSRYLWPEMFRAIREIRPRWVVAENVRGLLGWNEGLVLDTVCTDLENEGYEVWPFLLPACGVNAPHQRYRIWIIAHCADSGLESVQRKRENRIFESEIITNSDSYDAGRYRHGETECETSENQSQQEEWERFRSIAKRDGCERIAADPASSRLQKGDKSGTSTIGWEVVGFDGFPTQSPILGGDDGFSSQLDGITIPAWRRESIKAYGNAVVPQIPYMLFKNIVDFERTLKLFE